MPTVVSLVAGLIATNVIMSAAMAAAERWGWAAGVAVAVCAAVATSALSLFWKRPSLAWAAVIALAAGALGAMDGAEAAELARLPHARDITVAEAPRHASAGSFTFRDGEVRADLWGRSTRRSRTASHDYWAAPVVEPGWTSDRPVTVWAVCDAPYGCKREWEQRLRAGVRPTGLVSEELAQAVDDAKASHGLTSAADALVIRWVASVEDARAEPLERIRFGVRFWNASWIVTYLLGAAVAAWRRARAASAPIESRRSATKSEPSQTCDPR